MTIRWSRIAVFAVSFFVALLPAQAQAPSEAHTVPAGQSVALVTGSTGADRGHERCQAGKDQHF
jgi:hypothetical protein